MNVHTIRSKTVYVSPASYAALRAYADMKGLDTPDEAAEIWIQDRIWKEPKLMWFHAEMKKRLDALRKEAKDWPDEQARYDEMLTKERTHWAGIEKHGYDPTP